MVEVQVVPGVELGHESGQPATHAVLALLPLER